MVQQRIQGPTQTAVEGAAKEWVQRPFVARVSRVTLAIAPYMVGFAVALSLGSLFPVHQVGLHPLLWWLGIAVVSTLDDSRRPGIASIRTTCRVT